MTMTAQDIFTVSATHLLTQMQKSYVEEDDGSKLCQYRGPNGLKCAIGALIEDEFCNPEMETAINNPKALNALRKSGVISKKQIEERDTDPCIDLMFCLQNIHDSDEPVTWRYSLEKYAEEENLIMPEIS